MFLTFCFYVGYVFGMCSFVFVLFLVLLSEYEINTVFPAILAFLVMLVTR